MTQRETAGYFPWLAGMFIIAGIVHIVSVLALPSLAAKDAFARLAAIAPAGKLVLLPDAAPGREIVPFNDAQTAIAVCRYDLAAGPLRLKATIAGDSLLSFAFHQKQGLVFYSMTDRAAVRGRIDIVVATPAQIEALEAADNTDEPVQDLRLATSPAEGYVLLRALAERPGDMARARAQLQGVVCGPDRG